MFGAVVNGQVVIPGIGQAVKATDSVTGAPVQFSKRQVPSDYARFGFTLPVVLETLLPGEVCDGYAEPGNATEISGQLVRAAINKRIPAVPPISVSAAYLLNALELITATDMTSLVSPLNSDIQTWLTNNPSGSGRDLVDYVADNLTLFGVSATEATLNKTRWHRVALIDENHPMFTNVGPLVGFDTTTKINKAFLLAEALLAGGDGATELAALNTELTGS